MGRTPNAKPGEIKVQWGKDANDIMLVWRDGTSRSDAYFAYLVASSLREKRYGPVFLGELDEREV